MPQFSLTPDERKAQRKAVDEWLDEYVRERELPDGKTNPETELTVDEDEKPVLFEESEQPLTEQDLIENRKNDKLRLMPLK